MLLCVDPGLRACGAAIFRGTELVAAGFPTGDADSNMNRPDQRAGTWLTMAAAVRRWADEAAAALGEPIDELVIELPQVYRDGNQSQRKRGTDPNDLIHLACVVSAVSSTFATIDQRVVLPAEWKQQVPKEIMHERAMKRLGPQEVARLPKLPKSKLHNVLDALSIGLTESKRL